MVRTREDIQRANDQMRYAIRVLSGKNPPFETFRSNKIGWVLGVIEDLECFGWKWQSRILRAHLNRYLQNQRRGSDSSPEEREELFISG